MSAIVTVTDTMRKSLTMAPKMIWVTYESLIPTETKLVAPLCDISFHGLRATRRAPASLPNARGMPGCQIQE
jgi:hypothetical protein